MPLRRWLTSLQKSPLAMMLVAAGLLLALIQTEVRLQVAAYWETHPQEWQVMVALAAKDPGSVDWLARWQAVRKDALADRAKRAATEQAMQPKFDAAAIAGLLDKRTKP